MEKIIISLIVFIITYIIMYLILYLFKAKNGTLGTNKGVRYIAHRYNFKMNKEKVKKLSKLLVLENTIIVDIPIILLLTIEINDIVMGLLSLIIFIILLLLFYNLTGKYLQKKGW